MVFFEFSSLANTPELMVAATIKTPGSNHNTKEQAYILSTKAECYAVFLVRN